MDLGEQQPAAKLTAKGRATRARILDTAADLILRHGVAGTGLEDVRAAAGVSGSQMTHYFRDRDTLIHDVVAFQAESTLAQHQSPDLGGLATLASLRLWADRQIERQQERDCQGGCSFGSLAGQLAESSPGTRTDLAEGFTNWLALLRQGLEAMKASGELRADANPSELAYALLGTMQGGMLLTQTLRTIEPLQAAFDTALARVASFATDPAQATHILRLAPIPARTHDPEHARNGPSDTSG
jgi:TetR/AcrR family transcriptional repressor of nem operon